MIASRGHAYRQMAELYRAVRLYVNFSRPSMKPRLKERAGGKLRRRYDPPRLPYHRLLAAEVLSTPDRVRLTAIARTLDPVQLLRQIAQLQDALWKHAVTQMPESVAASIKAARDAMPTIHIVLVPLFHGIGLGLAGDIFISVPDDRKDWKFHKGKYTQKMSHYWDYKYERQHRGDDST